MVTETFPLEEALFELLKSPCRIKLLEESVQYLAKPESTRDVCDFIIKLAEKKDD